jgi:hypothetical protein
MSRKLLCLPAALLLVGIAFVPIAAAQEQIGILEFNPPSNGVSADSEFDILNITGTNSGQGYNSTTTYVTNQVLLTSLSLSVYDGATLLGTFGPSYFSEAGGTDPLELNGTPELFTGATSAVLTGDFSTTTLDMNSGGPFTVNATFSATISDSTGLVEGSDYQYIVATNGSSGPPPTTPEPESLLMVGTGLTALAGLRRRFLMASIRRFGSRLAGLAVVLAFVGVVFMAPASAHAQVGLAAWALPSTGLAGVSSSTLTASSYPAGETPSTVTVYFSTSCMGTVAASENPTSVSHYLGSIYHIIFPVPATLTSGNYFVWTTGTSPSYTSTGCSEITVTASSSTLAACVPTSSLGVVSGANVNAFVPNGSWCCSGGTGVQEVPLEGSGTRQTFATPGDVNSCAANSVTGEVVCVENGTNVDLINGSTVTTITSNAGGYAGFSGGDCENCGVGVNAGNNTAVIEEGGITGGSSGTGVQVLNLGSNTFNTPTPLNAYVSEDISIDSGRNLILSPGEGGVYDLLKIGAGNTLTEYSNNLSLSYMDSAAEDCTTGIALASQEGSDGVYITDLTQATFGASTWTAPGQFVSLNDGGYSAGTCGISTAPGTGHLAIVTGEFGGQSFAALKLPSTSGSGTPALSDWAYVAALPTDPSGDTFSAGYDPHTVTAYTSPNTNKAYGVVADYAGSSSPTYLAVIDLACVLGLPRTAGTHDVSGSAASCISYVSVH